MRRENRTGFDEDERKRRGKGERKGARVLPFLGNETSHFEIADTSKYHGNGSLSKVKGFSSQATNPKWKLEHPLTLPSWHMNPRGTSSILSASASFDDNRIFNCRCSS